MHQTRHNQLLQQTLRATDLGVVLHVRGEEIMDESTQEKIQENATEIRAAIGDFVFGTDDEIEQEVTAMSTEEIEAYLKANNISTEPQPHIKKKLDEARENLRRRVEAERQDAAQPIIAQNGLRRD